jgi:hypothetical protein
MELNSNRGQVLIECIVVVIFMASLLLYLHVHIEKSRKRVMKYYPKTTFNRKVINAKTDKLEGN